MTKQTPTNSPNHALCSCGHVDDTHLGDGLPGTRFPCRIDGCRCHTFRLDGYITEVTPASLGQQVSKPLLVAGDWI